MSNNSGDELVELSEAVINELRNNALILKSRAHEPAVVVASNDALGTAASAYADMVFELTGWGNPFAPPPVEEDEEEDPGEEGRLQVTLTYTLSVSSRTKLEAFLAARGLMAEPPAPGEDDEGGVGAVQALVETDGWRPEDYSDSGIVLHGKRWSVTYLSVDELS